MQQDDRILEYTLYNINLLLYNKAHICTYIHTYVYIYNLNCILFIDTHENAIHIQIIFVDAD